MLRVLPIAALALAACEAHPRPRGQITDLGHVGKLQQLAVRGDWLYITVMRDEPAGDKPVMVGPIDIWKARKRKGDAVKVAVDLPPGVTAYGAGTVYDAGIDGTVTAVDLATGERRTLAELHTYLYAIAVSEETIVVTTEREVIRLGLDGNKLGAQPAPAVIDRLIADGGKVAGASIASGLVVTIDADGRASAIGEPQNRPTCLGLTATHTFWARDLDGHKSELVGVARGGTVVDTLAALDSSYPTCATWKDRIYVADERQVRSLVAGEAPTKVATTGWVPALTATEDGVYWAQMIAAGWEVWFNAAPGT